MTRLQDFDYCTQLTAEHPILTDHRVHGERILPGVTFIDMIMQVLVSEKIALESIQLERMLFRTPICLAEGQSCDLRVRFVASEARIYVETRLHDDWVEHCRCQLSLANFPVLPAHDVQALKANAKTQKNLHFVYDKAKRLAINHGPFMQGEGVAYVGDDYVLAEIQLSEKAKASAADHIAHPALMDSATVVPFAAGIMGMESDNPFIPIAIENINLRVPLNNKVLVLAKISADGKADSDVLHNDILLLSETGEVIGRFLRLTAKCIRTAEAITGLHIPAEKSVNAPATNISATTNGVTTPVSILEWLTQVVAKRLNLTVANINIHQGFYELGLDSSALLDLVAQFEQELGCTLYPTLLFEHNTIHALADYFATANIVVPQVHVKNTTDVIAPPKTLFIKQTVAIEQASKNNNAPSLLDFITAIISEALTHNSQPDIHTGFYELGLDSNQLLSISNRLEKEFNTSLYPTLLFEYNTIHLLAGYFTEQQLQPANTQTPSIKSEFITSESITSEVTQPEAVIQPDVVLSEHADTQGDVYIWQSAWQEKSLGIQNNAAKNWLVVGDVRNFKSLDYLLQTKSKLYYFKDEVDEDYDELAQSFAEQVESCVSDKDFGGVIWLVPGREHQQHLQTAVMITQALAKTGKQLAIYALVHERNIAATALAGFWRSLRHELSRLQVRQIMSQSLAAYEWLAEFSAAPQGVELVRYHHGQREVEQLKQVDIKISAQSSPQLFLQKGAIVISGGFGGIATHLVEHLITQGWQQFALLGRKLPSEKVTQQLEQWRARGVEILAVAADVSHKPDITKAWRKIKNRFAQVSGVVHSAGVLRDGLVKDKTATQLQEVLAAKVTGANLLDKLSANEKLDFFVCFGSISGVLGNLGQSDYAYANAAMAVFMAERQERVNRQERSGRSLAIHWPLWRDGGMALSPERSNQLANLTGLQQIETAQALAAFDALLDSNNFPQAAYLPVTGNMDRFSTHLQQLGLFTATTAQMTESPKPSAKLAAQPNPAPVPAPIPVAHKHDDAIAIIGLAGVYPAANSIDSFWNNLTAGVDAITEIPPSRWDNAALFDDARGTPGKIYSRWGGFIEQADQFDAEFFGITPKEAELMDPQERLFLQVAWHTLEDAGLPVSGLTKSAVGVFVGAMWAQYQLLGLADTGEKQTASMFSAIANRVSYTLNLTGPSLAIDTMCSSTLSALHLAIESMRRGDCSMALVGGVNVMSHAHKYQYLCQNQMLSDDGKCRSFGEGGSGYVPGEGVGAVLLKPLAQAQQDGDNIHGIIRGSALNHGGRAAGMTVPNPGAQAKVIQAALADAGLEADRVSVVEAHGTGTLLGDPIELIGLKKVFGQNTSPVSIGSVKSNIGHLESAAGIAALSKVVLQLKHKQLLPSLHSQTLNSKLPLQDSPFVVQQSLAFWESGQPRVAGISAFGAGGSNAHVLVQEYETVVADVFHAQLVIPISARNAEALDRYVEQWITYLASGNALAPRARLADIAWSAQTGRDAMAERLALVCNNREEAIAQLTAFRNRQSIRGLFTAGDTNNPASEPEKLAAAFVAGKPVIWPAFGGSRVSIPNYPFAPTAYWYPRTTAVPTIVARDTGNHPLLHKVIPSIEGARFATSLNQQDLLVAQHNINSKTLVPAAAMLTMMVDGAIKLGMTQPLQLSQVTFGRALPVGSEGVQLRTCFYPGAGGEFLGEVMDDEIAHSAEKIYTQARILPGATELTAVELLPEIEHTADELYEQFSARGFAYGPAFRQITGYRHTQENEVWARLAESKSYDAITHSVLVLDAALQTSVLLQGDITRDEQAFLPYQLEDVSLVGDLTQAAWVRATRLADTPTERAFTLAIFAIDGRCLWACCRFSLRAAAGATAGLASPATASNPVATAQDKVDYEAQLRTRISAHLAQLLATHTGLERANIVKAGSFDQVGIDSIVVMNVTRELETLAGQLPKTLFFECPSVASLTEYLFNNHGTAFAATLGVKTRITEKAASTSISTNVPAALRSFAGQQAGTRVQEPLAIVGLAGRYPDAENVDQLWDNLKNGRDSVIEVPAQRWDIEQYYHPDKFNKHTTYCRHGGFIDKAECFDPAFFNMTPADALLADPQERIFLQTAWHALEDAGYARSSIAGKSVGVFAAVMWNQYQMFGLTKVMQGEQAGALSIASGLANRVSYTLNIKGPSLTLDTMCSSSLTALHLAARAIWNGDCESALVGGVNLSLHPHKYLSLCTSNFLSANGKCSAFGIEADGYVPAEAVGVVYLKPLSQAETDGDHIYGLVRATAINHVGTTQGATVPSPDAQAELIRRACQQAGVAPQSISYLEAHGTGTALGDPIEMRGLDKALNSDQNHPGCAIGSIKSNIGHPESAAGIASLTKVLLQLRHGQLAPSLHATPANPNIDFAGSPFRVNQMLCDWNVESAPRRAGIQSFGAGGSNAHVIVEEYRDQRPASQELDSNLLVLSARSHEQLLAGARRLLSWVESNRDASLTEVCYTLQLGREAFDHRFAAPVTSLDELVASLNALVDGEPERAGGNYYHLTANDDLDSMLANSEGKHYRETLLANRRWDGLGRLWLRGVALDWASCYSGFVRRARLPGYVFAEQPLLLPLDETAAFASNSAGHLRNLSDLYGQRYRSELPPRHPFLTHHQVEGHKLVPMAWFASLALAAAQQAAADQAWEIADLSLTQPLLAGDEPLTLDLVVEPTAGDGLDVIIFHQGSLGEQQVACASLQPRRTNVQLSTDDLAGLPVQEAATLYADFSANGFEYGTKYRQLQRISVNNTKALAELAEADTPWSDIAHPGVIDAALQLTRKLTAEDGRSWLPQTLQGFWFDAESRPTSLVAELIQDKDNLLEFRLYWCDAAQSIVGYCHSFSLVQAKGVSSAENLLLVGRRWLEASLEPVAVGDDVPLWIIEPNSLWLKNVEALPKATHIRWSDSNRIEHNNLWLATPDAAGMASLADRLPAETGTLRILIGDTKELAHNQTGFWCLWNLVRALVGRNLSRLELVLATSTPEPEIQALASWMHSLSEERPGYQLRLVQASHALDAGHWLAAVQQTAKYSRVTSAGTFEVYGLTERPLEAKAPDINGQTVLITGGAGGLGQVFARHLAHQYGCNLVLTGRKQADDRIKALIAELRSFDVEAVYYAIQIGDADAMANLARKIAQRFGGLDGVIHAAGVSNDKYILRQDSTQIAEVLQPKVAGTTQLLATLKELGRTKADLQPWIVGFSSISGFFGNIGQADYSFANAAMDAQLQDQSEVRSLSINWPLWDGVGMQLSQDLVAMMRKVTGMSPLPVALGLQLFDQALASSHTQLLPLYGDTAKIHAWASSLSKGLQPLASTKAKSLAAVSAANTQPLATTTLAVPKTTSRVPTAIANAPYAPAPAPLASVDIRALVAAAVASETGIKADTIDWDKSIDQYGFSSVVVTALTVALQKDLGELPKTLFFECRSLGQLAQYLETHHAPKAVIPTLLAPAATAPVAPMAASPKRDFRLGRNRDEIAIVGAAGRFPQADNLQAFWQNLVAGRDCVTAIPTERWTTGDAVADYAKGGFIADVDKFDARFFGMSTAEATAIDPQERLFLQTAWHSLEDAGIAPASIAGRKVGVYVGSMWGQYQLQGLDAWRNGTGSITVSSFASIANRVSYALDLKGPSVALDSMCSSSLVALKMAMDALNNGEIEYALVGGVNTSLHAYKYKQLQESMFLSKAGCCKAFGADGDGYVPGEGIVCLVLTRASIAKAQGIRERARLKGMAVAHGGNGNGYYVPNPDEQAEVIRQALTNARLAPETISYVEAHGTGTALGDPIEVRGLQKSYFTESKFPCAIGSVKANIGHLEGAAGMASICKVLLQMEHDQLVPSIHSLPQNPNIDFASTGLQVQRELTNWSALAGNGPRRAGISSFGAGGTNVHLILEAASAPLATSAETDQPSLFVLSAKDLPALQRLAQATLDWLPNQHVNIQQLAAASQGRQPLEYRLAWVISSRTALEQSLIKWLANPVATRVNPRATKHNVTSGAQLQELAQAWLAGDGLSNLLPTSVVLPPYPFARDRYWMDAGWTATSQNPTAGTAAIADLAVTPVTTSVAGNIRDQVIATVAEQLGYAPADIDLDADFNSLGVDSVQAGHIASRLRVLINSEVLPTAFYNYPNLGAFSQQLAENYQALNPQVKAVTSAPAAVLAPVSVDQQIADGSSQPIAIIGMSGAFAQAANLAEFWSNLKAGKESVQDVPAERWSLAEHYDPTPGAIGKTYSRRMGLMNGVGEFDPAFFGILPEEALAMEPQQRLFLTHSYLALEDAGISREQLDGSKTGVFAGAMSVNYRQLMPQDQTYSALSMIGNHTAALPARLAYWLNLKGPALVVDTACSASLMAVHLACNSLISGDSHTALAGGVFVSPGAEEQIASSAAGMLSVDGQCKTFSDNANGIAIGEGVGVVVLKTLAQAQADGDPIYAVIRACGVNQDGKSNGITAPNALSQGALVRTVLDKASLKAGDIQYIETHGTGTKLGDPVEIEGLKIAMGDTQSRILLGSVKPNIGHCYAAAGIASLIKVTMAVKTGELPPNIHAGQLNSLIPFAKLPFAVNRQLQAWPDCDQRRAGVSAFGYTGTNVHLVIEEAPKALLQVAHTELPLLLPLSARRAQALGVLAGKLADYLDAHPHTDLRQFTYTLQVGRSALDHRKCLLVADHVDAIAQLRALAAADEKSLARVKRKSEQPATHLGKDCVARADWAGLIELWQAGMTWDWAAYYSGKFTRLNLPTSELERKIYWPQATAEQIPVPNAAQSGGEQGVITIRQGAANTPLLIKSLTRTEFKNIA